MRKLSLITLIALLFFAFACNESETDKEKLKAELKEELRQEMQAENESKEKSASENKEESDESNTATKEKNDERYAASKRSNPTTVDFDADMLENLTLYGDKNLYRLKEEKLVSYSLTDGSQKRSVSYDTGSADPKLKNAVQISGNKMTIKVHEDFAIGGVLEIRKTDCKRGYKTGFKYSFKITWRAEPGFNDTGCAFHSREEYQITAKVDGIALSSGGAYYTFSDNNGNNYNFYDDYDKEAVDLKKVFPGLEPLNEANPFKNKQYKIFYKYVEVESHKGFRVEPIVTYIEEI